MKILYLDSSAWVKRHESEAGSEWLGRLWRPGVRSGCADLGLIEVLCTISRRHATHHVDNRLTDAVLRAVRRDYDAFVQISLDPDVLRLAEPLAARRRLRGADCVHLASAIHLRLFFPHVTLIASDSQLLAAASAEGFAVLDPAGNPAMPE